MEPTYTLHKISERFIITSDEEVKEDDIAIIPNYAGFVTVGTLDDMPYSEPHRNWQGLNCDTCFDVEAVSKFTKVIAQQDQIDFSLVENIINSLNYPIKIEGYFENNLFKISKIW